MAYSSRHFIAAENAHAHYIVHGLPRLGSARFEHGGGSTSNMKGEYVVLVCQKYYLPT